MASPLHGHENALSAHRDIPLELVLLHAPVPVVAFEIGRSDIAYQNAAAARHAEIWTLGDDEWFDKDGNPVAAERIPRALAARGEPLERGLYQLRLAKPMWLSCSVGLVDGTNLAVLTFEDATDAHASQEELRKAVAARDDLVSMAAHEFRSPIAALGLVAEQLRRKEVPVFVQDLARIALRQVRRLTLLVGNLLDVSRLRAGRFELDREPCTLRSVVREAAEHLVDQARSEKVELTVAVETDARGQWDAGRMDQVISNLVTNAIKYGGRTPITLRLAAVDADHVELSVEDRGPGVAEADRARIFTPYVRANSGWKGQSLGLGLYIVSEIVRAHNGTIQLDSKPGCTRFTVILPIER